MHQSVANTAQLAPRTNLIRILKYFKKSCFFAFFFKKMKIMPQNILRELPISTDTNFRQSVATARKYRHVRWPG